MVNVHACTILYSVFTERERHTSFAFFALLSILEQQPEHLARMKHPREIDV